MALKIRVSTVRFRLWPPLTNQALRPSIRVAFLLFGVTITPQSACRVKFPSSLVAIGALGNTCADGNFERTLLGRHWFGDHTRPEL
jgi:hypothetical protein